MDETRYSCLNYVYFRTRNIGFQFIYPCQRCTWQVVGFSSLNMSNIFMTLATLFPKAKFEKKFKYVYRFFFSVPPTFEESSTTSSILQGTFSHALPSGTRHYFWKTAYCLEINLHYCPSPSK